MCEHLQYECGPLPLVICSVDVRSEPLCGHLGMVEVGHSPVSLTDRLRHPCLDLIEHHFVQTSAQLLDYPRVRTVSTADVQARRKDACSMKGPYHAIAVE